MAEIKGRIVHVDPYTLARDAEVQVLVRFRRSELLHDPMSLMHEECRLSIGPDVAKPGGEFTCVAKEDGGFFFPAGLDPKYIEAIKADMRAAIEKVRAARNFPPPDPPAEPDPPPAGYKYGGML